MANAPNRFEIITLAPSGGSMKNDTVQNDSQASCFFFREFFCFLKMTQFINISVLRPSSQTETFLIQLALVIDRILNFSNVTFR